METQSKIVKVKQGLSLAWRGLVVAIKVLTFVWLPLHFALTVIYVAPINTIRLAVPGLVEKVIGRYFPQNWNLFAPNPVSANDALFIRCMNAEEHARVAKEGWPQDGWLSPAAVAWQRFHKNRFGAYDHLMRTETATARAMIDTPPTLAVWQDACSRGNKQACDIYEKDSKMARKYTAQTLARLGSSYCNALSAQRRPAQPYSHVALRQQVIPPLSWSERGGKRSKAVEVDLDIYPVNTSIEPNKLLAVQP